MPRSPQTAPRSPARVIMQRTVRESVNAVARQFASVGGYSAPIATIDEGTGPFEDADGNVQTLHSFMLGVDSLGDATAILGEVAYA